MCNKMLPYRISITTLMPTPSTYNRVRKWTIIFKCLIMMVLTDTKQARHRRRRIACGHWRRLIGISINPMKRQNQTIMIWLMNPPTSWGISRRCRHSWCKKKRCLGRIRKSWKNWCSSIRSCKTNWTRSSRTNKTSKILKINIKT